MRIEEAKGYHFLGIYAQKNGKEDMKMPCLVACSLSPSQLWTKKAMERKRYE
jgi:hypothetical protein